MAAPLRRTRVIEELDARTLPVADLIAEGTPAILRGIAGDLPIVAAGRQGAAHAIEWLRRFDGGRPVTAYVGEPVIGGRFGYNDDLSGLNFARERGPLGDYLDRLRDGLDDLEAPYIYIGSTDIDQYLPGLREEAVLPFGDPQLATSRPLVSAWIGNRTIAATHYDMSNNMASCLVGRRRFTLFPPAQVANLYPGPLDLTPAGQVVSMVDLRAPDFQRFPRFEEALESAEVAELEPGDVLIYPALWWHNVEALDAFNIMINYWWNPSPAYVDTPQNTLLHALLSLRDRPAGEKEAWRHLFDYYVFGEPERAGAHLPPAARGALAPLDDMGARRLRAQLLQRFNR
ncbi:Cupin-like domain-containing protein [Sphingomonas guangdongensis]|uniref:Cupin-like domain-containing protein n=1 Tax=Sphingomonas guangdongensis TaxID=1141890 RepID=A0A285QYJ2_9SPHN|nr:cupin-like domain-containing protein [Sphingomonas guangdongensis]SOB86538.1 Cupin-like domain-containing protein [Sphingomonas guangdongensis]